VVEERYSGFEVDIGAPSGVAGAEAPAEPGGELESRRGRSVPGCVLSLRAAGIEEVGDPVREAVFASLRREEQDQTGRYVSCCLHRGCQGGRLVGPTCAPVARRDAEPHVVVAPPK